MPALASVVGEISGLGFPIQCHQATLYWLVRARLDRDPTTDEFLESSNIIRKLTRFGTPVGRPEGPFTVQPGTVLVFTGCGDGHSCITITWNALGGYNQQGWMPGGKSCKYTAAKLTDIKWIDKMQVRGGNDASKCTLVRINEPSALGNIEVAIAEALAAAH